MNLEGPIHIKHHRVLVKIIGSKSMSVSPTAIGLFQNINEMKPGHLGEMKTGSCHNGMCGSPPGVMMADTLSFNAKIGLVDF